jgi:hypothetical protein
MFERLSHDVDSALLGELERRLRSAGVRRICALLPDSATGAAALENSGYVRRDGLVYYELLEHLGPDQANLLDELMAQIASLASIYHKPPESFVMKALHVPGGMGSPCSFAVTRPYQADALRCTRYGGDHRIIERVK